MMLIIFNITIIIIIVWFLMDFIFKIIILFLLSLSYLISLYWLYYSNEKRKDIKKKIQNFSVLSGNHPSVYVRRITRNERFSSTSSDISFNSPEMVKYPNRNSVIIYKEGWLIYASFSHFWVILWSDPQMMDPLEEFQLFHFLKNQKDDLDT